MKACNSLVAVIYTAEVERERDGEVFTVITILFSYHAALWLYYSAINLKTFYWAFHLKEAIGIFRTCDVQ